MFLGWYKLSESCDDDNDGSIYTFDKIPEDIC